MLFVTVRTARRKIGNRSPSREEIPVRKVKMSIARLSASLARFYQEIEALEAALIQAEEKADPRESAESYHDGVLAAMEELRRTGDEMESITAKKYWPYPSYSDMLFSV